MISWAVIMDYLSFLSACVVANLDILRPRPANPSLAGPVSAPARQRAARHRYQGDQANNILKGFHAIFRLVLWRIFCLHRPAGKSSGAMKQGENLTVEVASLFDGGP